METVKENIAALMDAKQAVKNHCMCARFVEEPGRFIVYFPAGFQADAAQMRFGYHGVSKTKALEVLLTVMEKYWKRG